MKKGVNLIAVAGGVLAVIAVVVVTLIFLTPRASEGLEFRSNNDGTCTWVGLGTCEDTEIVVPEKNGDEVVVSVGENTLDQFDTDAVVKIVLPETIKIIEKYAFYGLHSLETVVLNEGLERIESRAFSDCPNLREIKFPSTLKFIGEWSFGGCKALTEIILPEGLAELESFAFEECSGVKKISIPSTINKLKFKTHPDSWGGYQFDMTSLEEFIYAGEFNYTNIDVWMDENSNELKFHYYGELVRDVSEEKYPGAYFEITDANRESIICALLGKDNVIVNGNVCKMTTEKPNGIYEVPGWLGFYVEEFKDDSKLNISYRGTSSEYNVEDVVCGEYLYDETENMYMFGETGSYDGMNVIVEKIFVNFGDFLYSLDYLNMGNSQESMRIFKWVPYTETIKAFVEEGANVEIIEEDKLEEVVNKKEDLLAALIEAFRREGITVSVDSISGELALDASVLFGGDSSELTTTGKEFLNKFVKVYTSVIYSEKFDGFVKKTIIEGHTAKLEGSTYESGLPLSEERANTVKEYCLSSEIEADTAKLGAALDAIGCSNSKPIYTSQGEIDKAASRRVSFRFTVNLE